MVINGFQIPLQMNPRTAILAGIPADYKYSDILFCLEAIV